MTNATRVLDRFDMTGRVALITGGAGFLGRKHARAILELGGTVLLADVDGERAENAAVALREQVSGRVEVLQFDVTVPGDVDAAFERVVELYDRLDVLVNNAANDPSVTQSLTDRPAAPLSRLEEFTTTQWERDIAVGLTGAFLCSRRAGDIMARVGKGVILNVASDLSVIAPDQRIYRQGGVADDAQPVKPVTYSVIKHGLVGLTRYLATYWAESGIRVNALSPGGVQRDQPPEFVSRLSSLIPMNRMAQEDEYCAAVAFLVSDASSYMTGQNVVIDGGRTVW